MRIVAAEEWPGTKDELVAKIAEFSEAKEAHKQTIGVPAPLPEAPIIEELYVAPDDFTLAKDLPVDVIPEGPNVPNLALDRQLAISHVMDKLILAAAAEKNAPDFVTRAATAIGPQKQSTGPIDAKPA